VGFFQVNRPCRNVGCIAKGSNAGRATGLVVGRLRRRRLFIQGVLTSVALLASQHSHVPCGTYIGGTTRGQRVPYGQQWAGRRRHRVRPFQPLLLPPGVHVMKMLQRRHETTPPPATLSYVEGRVAKSNHRPAAAGPRRHAAYHSMQNPLFRRLGFLRSLHSAKQVRV
jgi:hypothetical protein